MLARTVSQQPVRRVLVHGLVYFGDVFAEFMSGHGWEFKYYPDQGFGNLTSMAQSLRQCDLVYQIGGRVSVGKFLGAARLFGKNRIVMHWVGSDTLDQKKEVAAGKSDPWVLKQIHHWADSDWIFNEVKALGISGDFVPLPSPRAPEKPVPLPKDFCVLVYVPSIERTELYGLDMILEVARKLPGVPFELVGLRDGPIPNVPANLRTHIRLPNLSSFYERASVVWRPARHDGLSWMVLESLAYGRHVLWTYPFPACTQVSSAKEAEAEIRKLLALHQEQKLCLNEPGVSFMASSEYNPKRFKTNILSRLTRILEG